jgi:hypothetical protein
MVKNKDNKAWHFKEAIQMMRDGYAETNSVYRRMLELAEKTNADVLEYILSTEFVDSDTRT